jgi:hypothetical protein
LKRVGAGHWGPVSQGERDCIGNLFPLLIADSAADHELKENTALKLFD